MRTFGEDIAFLSKFSEIVVLEAEDSPARLAVTPAMQGRVMTSTLEGDKGLSFGWINRDLIPIHERQDHINAFGGEDRFWLGPEGGQFSIFFKKDEPFDLAHWQTPGPIDWGWWNLSSKSKTSARFDKKFNLTNHHGTKFTVSVDRKIRIHTKTEIASIYGFTLPESVKAVSFESENKLTNNGESAWHRESGLLSIWILGMMNPSPGTTVVIPFIPGSEEELGPVVNDAYFGKPAADRLHIDDKGVLYFKGDGKLRSKIGLSPSRAKNILGSYNTEENILTLVTFSLPEDAKDYVNSMWEMQEKPYAGDVVNSYNDGPAGAEGKSLGPFYELESSSPAVELGINESITHTHRTIHLQGDPAQLSTISQQTLGVDLETIKSVF